VSGVAALVAALAPASADTVAVAPTAGSAAVSTADPMPPEQVDASAKLDAKRIKTLTDDPIVGKAHAVSGEEHPGVVAFTFDDGPNPETSPIVIDALEKYDIPATFFIITQNITGKGEHATKSRDVLQRELDRGFLVGAHSVTHPNLKNATGDQIEKEVDGSLRALALAAQRPIGMFRPPYGSLSGAGRMRLHQLEVTEVQWSIDTLDWKAKDAQRLRKKVMKMILDQNGGVVLMHDRVKVTSEIIASVFDDLEAENCSRLAAGKEPIWPVSIHYFLRERDKTPRIIPKDVEARTVAYKAELPTRCAARNDPAGS
jgi:peptidoglycan/xylan/chitin deacetylase (PgdA/CDA1 family)